ncbi:L-ascorbate oxidase-like protein [Hibiscus syriacus]|uniref:L-ascorbate oxidase-like protein n=1 Tax=Hibiscus syriacus TaxID=106335 RepID=A0A6A2YE26_HIBSY|nr:L-ascorbate oxidase-like protein [Hibiscus syriacus]
MTEKPLFLLSFFEILLYLRQRVQLTSTHTQLPFMASLQDKSKEKSEYSSPQLIPNCPFNGFFFKTNLKRKDPYRFYTWNVTYGDIYPLGVKQQGILINGQFPGPLLETVTNENLIINVFNSLDQPFLISWNGVQQRRNSWQDGVYGTNCPIPPGGNFTYTIQVKDQIGSYFYFPSLALHKAAGGYGGLRIHSRSVIPVPFPPPAADYTILAGDWYNKNHCKTYRFRISNVGITTSINFRIQGHKLLLVEVEGTHTLQNTYDSLDVHLGQSLSLLVTADQPTREYYIVASTRFTSQVRSTTAVLRYSNSEVSVSGPIPGVPTTQIDWSLEQARSIRENLTASGPRPNPQGTYHYGLIKTARTIRLASSASIIDGKQRYAVNSVSFIPADTPLKLADYFNISGVFSLGSIPYAPTGGGAYLQTSVMAADHRSFLEIVFENPEDTVQSWHIDGTTSSMDRGQWTPASRLAYNLRDTISRCTVQVYPKSWSAVYMAVDNVGMWNVRSENWSRQYLGQQFYLRVFSAANSWRDEYPIPKNALLCGRATRRPHHQTEIVNTKLLCPSTNRIDFRSCALPGLDFGNVESVLEAAGVLTAIIVVHETGHFLAASPGNPCNFPIGWIRGFPDNDLDSDIPDDDENLLKNRPILDRIIVISAGVVANIIFAYAIIFTQVLSVGLPVQEPFSGVLVPEVRPFSAASRDGLLPGDFIIAINGVELPKTGTSVVSQVVDIIRKSQRNVVLKVERAKQDFEIGVVPDENFDGTGKIGVQLSPKHKKKIETEQYLGGLRLTGKEFWGLTYNVLDSLKQTFMNFSQSASKVSGPVAIIAVGAEVARSTVDGLYEFAAPKS